MKNGTSLVLLTVLVMVFGGIAGFAVFGNPSATLGNLKARFGQETTDTIAGDQTEIITESQSERVDTISNDIVVPAVASVLPREEAPAEAGADDFSEKLPVDSDEESAADPAMEEYSAWKTLSGNDFEAKLIWVSDSGKSLRFERRDGSTFVYAAGSLAPESREKMRTIKLATNGHHKIF